MSKYMVFYQKIPNNKDGRMFDEAFVVTKEDIPTRYSYMATVEAEKGLEEVFMIMNGMHYTIKNPLGTPDGQRLVELSGTGHTSMSVNDIVVDLNTGAIYRVKGMGFEVLGVML